MTPIASFMRAAKRLAPACLLLSLACVGSSDGDRDRGANVLLVSIDTLRNDHVSIAGYDRPTTPHLDALARQGTHMALAYAPTATTGPTHASIFTSLYPIAHGVVKNGMTLGDGPATLAETLREHGYDTAAVVSSFVLDSKFGYARGFDSYEDRFEPDDTTLNRTRFMGETREDGFDQRASATTPKALRALERLAAAERPFFLFVHYFDPHAPYVPPSDWAGRFVTEGAEDGTLDRTVDAYDAEIAFADDELGKLLGSLRGLGLERDTLVIVTADHGEGLMQHGHMHHGVHIYEEAVRVPLVFRLPGHVAGGARISEPVELVDLFPTVLDLVGLPAVAELHGRSLAAPLAGTATLDPEHPVFLHRRHYQERRIGEIDVAGEKFGIRMGRWKYIEGEAEGTRELFDLTSDPSEQSNVIDRFQDVAQDLSARIAAWKAERGRDTALDRLSPDDLERLRALGYVE